MAVKTAKTFVGPRLRRLRRERGQTQSEMAQALGISPAYVNLLEHNQRSLSVKMLLAVSETYGVDWRDLVEDDTPALLTDLRAALQDPIFGEGADLPDLQELRAAADHAPRLARSLLLLHQRWRGLADRVSTLAEGDASAAASMMSDSPDSVVHDLFRSRRNHFPEIEDAAERFRKGEAIAQDEMYVHLKRRLAERHGVETTTSPPADLPATLRWYDEDARRIDLSEGLDHPNRVFQLAHVTGLIAHGDVLDGIIDGAGIGAAPARARCRVELANYFAAAVLMPYSAFRDEAEGATYDIDYVAARFGVSYEQACQRLTTLQREGAQGIPFFFLRVDKAGNVTKRFSASSFHLAEFGGACPRWDIHLAFRTPGRILPQFVEMPDGARFFTINRTVDRPATGRHSMDHRLATTLGCPVEYADRIAYGQGFRTGDPGLMTPIGINCRLCPRQNCSQRAHSSIHLDGPVDAFRRGPTRFDA